MMTGQASTSSSLRLRQAILSNDIPLVERLLQAYPHLLHNPDYNDKSNTSLHLAARAGHAELVVGILLACKKLIDIKQELLISKGHDQFLEVVDYIYSSSANNLGISLNTDGQTAMHLAASRLHVEVIEVLCIEFPNTINRPDKLGRTPLLLAAGAHIPTTTKLVGGRKNTLQATEDIRVVEALLKHGADVGAKDREGNTCLHQACAWGNLKTVRALVQAGADPLSENYSGWKPDAYSLSVQADVYFRNLVVEFEKRKAEEVIRKRDERRPVAGGGGLVRIVSETDEDDEDEGAFFDADESKRGRAGSAKSNMNESYFEKKRDNLGLNINVGVRLDSWR